MTEAEFLERMDRHIAVSKDHMARGNELMGEVREEMRLTREEMRLNREERAESREFMRELSLRNERFTNTAIQRMNESIGANTSTLRDVQAEIRDVREEMAAFRKSLWRVHDKLEDLRPEDLG